MTCGPSTLTIHRSPDCAAGKHTGCTGDAWCDTNDLLVACSCGCHLDEL